MNEHTPIKLTIPDLQQVLDVGKNEDERSAARTTVRINRNIDTFVECAVSAKYLQDLNDAVWNQDFFNQFQKDRRSINLNITKGIKDE